MCIRDRCFFPFSMILQTNSDQDWGNWWGFQVLPSTLNCWRPPSEVKKSFILKYSNIHIKRCVLIKLSQEKNPFQNLYCCLIYGQKIGKKQYFGTLWSFLTVFSHKSGYGKYFSKCFFPCLRILNMCLLIYILLFFEIKIIFSRRVPPLEFLWQKKVGTTLKFL